MQSIARRIPRRAGWLILRKAGLGLALILPAQALGCATLVSRQIIPTDTAAWSGRPFSGVEMDAEELQREFQKPASADAVLSTPFLAADLLLSAVGDTALLPVWAMNRLLTPTDESSRPEAPSPASETPQ
ncbi:MAG: YceK/YidQ family lipoprotein [Planctomycetes bacterium]|nr:YceK/YidQ family lipoprotein [Planctomycetota bacterium]